MRFARATFAQLRRLHPFTWCVVALVSVPLLLVVLPGTVADSEPMSSWHAAARKQLYWSTAERYESLGKSSGQMHRTTVRIYEHGWPMPCMLRSLGSFDTFSKGQVNWSRNWATPWITLTAPPLGKTTGTPIVVSWSDRDHWPLESEFVQFHWGYLLLNLVAIALVLAVTAAFVEWWIRARGGVFRFRILDLLILSTGSSIVLAWYFYHHRITLQEDEAVVELTDNISFCSAMKDYAGPVWLARLAGSEQMLPFLYHYDQVHWYYDRRVQTYDEWDEQLRRLRRIKCVRTVTLPDGVPLDLVERLDRETKLDLLTLRFEVTSDNPFDPADATVHSHNLTKLAPLRVSHLGLVGAHVLADDIATAASLPSVRVLALHDVSATTTEIESIRNSHPNVEITSTRGTYKTPEPVSEAALARQIREQKSKRKAARELTAGSLATQP